MFSSPHAFADVLLPPLFLGRNCGADYIRLSGDPASGQMRPSARDAPGQEWMLYDVIRQETTAVMPTRRRGLR